MFSRVSWVPLLLAALWLPAAADGNSGKAPSSPASLALHVADLPSGFVKSAAGTALFPPCMQESVARKHDTAGCYSERFKQASHRSSTEISATLGSWWEPSGAAWSLSQYLASARFQWASYRFARVDCSVGQQCEAFSIYLPHRSNSVMWVGVRVRRYAEIIGEVRTSGTLPPSATFAIVMTAARKLNSGS